MIRSYPSVLVAGLFWLILPGACRAYTQQAIRTVKALGGSIDCDDQEPAHPVVILDLTNTKATDTTLREVALLTTTR